MSHNHAKDIDHYLAILRKNGGRITPIRRTILDFFIEDPQHLVSANELLQQLNLRLPKKNDCDLVTVYRALENFEELRIVTSTDLGDGIKRFELSHSDHHHHHVVCTQCRSIKIIDDCALSSIEIDISKSGYSNVTHRLEFFGTCPKCTPKRPALKSK